MKETEKQKNIMKMENQNLKVNIYMVIKEEEKIISTVDQNLKENIYLIKKLMEKVMMKMVR